VLNFRRKLNLVTIINLKIYTNLVLPGAHFALYKPFPLTKDRSSSLIIRIFILDSTCPSVPSACLARSDFVA